MPPDQPQPHSGDRPVLVIGGSRGTGMHAVRALHRRGIPVRVLARDPAAARGRLGEIAEIVPGDVTRRDSLLPAMQGISHIIFTAGVRSGRFARRAVVEATEYEGVLNTLSSARAQSFSGRFVYMTSIGVTRPSLFAVGLNLWKGDTLRWRRRAEDAIRRSELDYVIVRTAVLLDRSGNQRAIAVGQEETRLTFTEFIARADVADGLVEALYHPDTPRATFEVRWRGGPRRAAWGEMLTGLKPD